MQNTPDTMLLQQLREEKDAPFELLYKTCFPPIAAYITQHRGSTADAEDVFQEAIIVLVHKLRQPGFALSASLKTYLFAIAKNTWLKKQRDNREIRSRWLEAHATGTENFSVDLHPTQPKEEKLYSWLTKITVHCQRILKALFFYREPMESVMARLGWKNKHTAANQQYKCIQQIKKQKDMETGDN